MTGPTLPVLAAERVEALDILRGLAMFGVFVMILLTGAKYEPSGFGEATDFLVANKALSLLSLLFGAGFAVQVLRSGDKRRGVTMRYLRRMVVLFVLGAMHWILLWNTILISYAVIGCTLLLIYRLPVRMLIAVACLLMIAAQFQGLLLQSINRSLGQDSERMKASREARLALNKRVAAAKSNGTYKDFVAVQWETLRDSLAGPVQWVRLIFPAYYLPMAVLGLAAVKVGLLRELAAKRKMLKVVMWVALVVGLASNPLPYLPLGSLGLPQWVYRTSFLLSGPSLGLFYACAAVLAVQTERGHKLLGWLRWPGRMAFSNYVAQTAIVVTIYYGCGLGLMKQLTVLHVWAMALTLFPALAVMSAAWLRRHEFGPLEWVWRTLTYGRLGPGLRALS